MKATIMVNNKQEAEAIRGALEDPTMRAFVLVMGALLQLPSDKARRRVLAYVKDRMEEDSEESLKA